MQAVKIYRLLLRRIIAYTFRQPGKKEFPGDLNES
jgi:hypothetical protein